MSNSSRYSDKETAAICFLNRPNELLWADADVSNLNIGRRSESCERAARHPPAVSRR